MEYTLSIEAPGLTEESGILSNITDSNGSSRDLACGIAVFAASHRSVEAFISGLFASASSISSLRLMVFWSDAHEGFMERRSIDITIIRILNFIIIALSPYIPLIVSFQTK